MSPVAGVIVESMPRRRLLIMTQTIQMGLAFILAALTALELVEVWHIVILAFILGITNALDMPARQVFIIEVVGREDLHSGITLNSILNSSARVLGPTMAGIALVLFGSAWCFFINGATFLAVLVSLFVMKVPHAIEHVQKKLSPLQQLREGISFARHDELVAPLILLATVVGIFVIPIIQLLPAYADVVLFSPKEGYAAVSTAQGIGSVIAGVAVGWLAYRFGYGKLIAITLELSAIATVIFALQVDIVPASIASIFMGLFLIMQMVCINTLLQTVVPDEFRGRVMSLYTLALLGLAPFGALALGAVASLIGTAQAIVLSGILSGICGGLVFVRWSGLITRKHAS